MYRLLKLNKFFIIILISILSVTVNAQEYDFSNHFLSSNILSNNFISNSFLHGNSLIQKNLFNSYMPLYSTALNQSTSGSPNLGVFDHFGQNFLNSFKGDNLYLQLAGVASTFLIVSTNTDYHVEHYFNQHESYSNIARPVVFTGMFLPFVASGSLYAYAKFKNDNEVLGASFAVMQATITEFLYNSLLKAITGRPHPDWQHTSDMKALSKTFRFGFDRGGIFWGWPSGHTAATTAVVSALIGYYPNSTWLKVAGFSLMAYTIFGVSAFHRGGMHWFSDAVAAAFMSYEVGSTIGKYYRSRFSNTGSQSSNIMPSIGTNLGGFSFSIQF